MQDTMTRSFLVLNILTFLFKNWYHYLIRIYGRTSEATHLKIGQNIQEELQFKNLVLFLLSPYEFLLNQQKCVGVDVFLNLKLHNLKTL